MRNLKTSDLFILSKIIKKMDIKSDIKALSQDLVGKTDEEKIKAEQGLQIDLLMLFTENIGSAEKEIYNLLADLEGKKPKEIEDMELAGFIVLIKELFEQESLTSLFSMALA